jgi:hypothetical protein
MRGWERFEAREAVRGEVEEILNQWQEKFSEN